MNSKFFFVALNGQVQITLNDGNVEEEHFLNGSRLFVDSGIWIRADRFSSKDTPLMVLSDMIYQECNYVYDYNKYLDLVSDNE